MNEELDGAIAIPTDEPFLSSLYRGVGMSIHYSLEARKRGSELSIFPVLSLGRASYVPRATTIYNSSNEDRYVGLNYSLFQSLPLSYTFRASDFACFASLGLTLALQRRERKEDFRVPYPNSVSVPEYYLLEYSEYYAREKLSRLSLLHLSFPVGRDR